MLAVPVDAWYAWIGLALVAGAVLTAALSVPTTPPPDARDAANAIDRVAARSLATEATVATKASAVRIGPERIGLRNEAGTRTAALSFGPIVPATGDPDLRALAAGTHPSARFAAVTDLATAVDAARSRAPTWTETDGTLVVRRVRWEGYDVVIVAT